jgi:hypothetical protein
MKIAITFEHIDLIQFIEDMLAVKGMKPIEPIVFQRKRNKGPTHNAVPGAYEVVVMCEDTAPRETCPMCQHALHTEAATPTPRDRSLLMAEPVVAPSRPVNLMEGELTEPPFGNEAAPGDEGESGGMASIVAQSRAIEAVKTREKEARRFSKKPNHE